MRTSNGLLPDEPAEEGWKPELICEFWSALYNDGDAGAATWEALDCIRDRVTAALGKQPPDCSLAESLTAKAALMISLGES